MIKFKIKFFILAFILGSTQFANGCATTNNSVSDGTNKYDVIKDAILLQEQAISDPLFSDVLNQLENQEEIWWRKGALASHERNNRSEFSSDSDWLIFNYRQLGVLDSSNIVYFKSFLPWSQQTAGVNPCYDKVSINKRKLGGGRDKFDWANTLVHERIHAFCLKHTGGQTRPANNCDIGYIAGDLAEAILIHRDTTTSRQLSGGYVCPALCESLAERDINVCKNSN